MMQTDVKSGHLNNSGFVVLGRNRLKAVSMVGTATAGTLDIFDTTTAPVAATYERAGTLITVTKSAHGLQTGNVVGLTFATASGSSGTNGNYTITRIALIPGEGILARNGIYLSMSNLLSANIYYG